MRRLARHVFTLCSAVSLVLCVTACALWVRSYFPEHFYVAPVDGRLVLLFADDNVRMHWTRSRVGVPNDPHVSVPVLWAMVKRGQFIGPDRTTGGGSGTGGSQRLFAIVNTPPDVRAFLGVEYVTETAAGVSAGYTLVAVPFAYPALLLAIAPGLWVFRRVRARRRHGDGRCENCGYDLIPSPKPVIAILADEQQQPTPPA
jgi:hypothetical protein